VGLPLTETPRDQAFCLHNLSGRDLLVVEDAAADPRFADNPLVTGPPGIRFYAGAPLVTPDGLVLGSLCGIDTAPRRAETMDLEVLHDLAAIVVRELELRLASAELRERSRRVRDLMRELGAAQENGRSHLSRALQEELQQGLQAARIGLDTAADSDDSSPDQAERLRRVGADLEAASDLVRSLAARFAPPVANQPLLDTLRWLAGRMRADHGLSVVVQGDPAVDLGADEGLKTLLYRMVREELFAARRRGAATTARVHVAAPGGRLRIVVEDDRRGDIRGRERASDDGALARLRTQLHALGGRVDVHAEPDGHVVTVKGPPPVRASKGAAPAMGDPRVG
jgi:signal transduction histidine kinase